MALTGHCSCLHISKGTDRWTFMDSTCKLCNNNTGFRQQTISVSDWDIYLQKRVWNITKSACIFSGVCKLYRWVETITGEEPFAKICDKYVIWSNRRDGMYIECILVGFPLLTQNFTISSILEFNYAERKRKKSYHPKQKAWINNSEIFCWFKTFQSN